MQHVVQEGLIFCDEGIPLGQRWFADNRLAVQFDATGVTRVEYRNPGQLAGNPIVFLKGLHDGFRYYIEHEGITFKAEYKNSSFWPFGVESEWPFESVVFQHGVYTVGDALIIKLATPGQIPTGLKFKLEFNEPFSFIPTEQSNFLWSEMGAARTWQKWEFDEFHQVLKGRYVEKLKNSVSVDEKDIRDSGVELEEGKRDAALSILTGADFPLEHVKRNSKHILLSKELAPGTEYYFVTLFKTGDKDAVSEYKKELGNIKKVLEKQFDRYRKVIRSSPKLISPYPQLNAFFTLAPLYHESLKATEYPGAIRAKTSNYWVWGWDGMSSNCATLYWGDQAFIGDMLRFYEKTAHPEKGIAHAYRNDMSVASVSDLPAQGMYITLLHHYYNATHDIETVKERYEFAKKVFKNIAASEVNGTGFCKGTSLFPDFPIYMKETGHDISAFNNTVFYCASRSMEYLASLLGDKEMSMESECIFRKMENHFIKLFYDEKKKFIVNSVDANTLQKRECYSSNAIKWENEYCNDLFETIHSQCLDFFTENFVCKAGIRPMPVWDSAFDGDANQLHSWWPVMGEYYMKLINENNRVDLINQWVGWVSYWTGKLTIPEGISCYINTAEPEMDRWDTLCGTWQAYSMRGWYQAAIHGVIGVGIDAGGITFYPYEGEEMKLLSLHYLDKLLDIDMCGSGRYIESVEIDGQDIRGTNKLPSDLLNYKKVCIKVKRVKENPYKVYVKSASGVEWMEYRHHGDRLTAKIKGAGTSRIKLVTSDALKVRLNGEEVRVQYNKTQNLATVEVKLWKNETRELEVLIV